MFRQKLVFGTMPLVIKRQGEGCREGAAHFIMILPLTPLRFLERAQRLYGKKEAVLCGAHRFTYTRFFERCQRLAGALLGLGLQPGDRVALLSYNCHRLLESYFGVLQARGVLMPLNIRLAPPEIAYILKDSEARFLFLDPDFLPLVESIKSQLPENMLFFLLEPAETTPVWIGPPTYDQLLEKYPPVPFDYLSIDENAIAELFYTSGTSGDPKGVMLSHRTVYLHALNVLAIHRITDQTVQLHTIPLFHANGWGCAHTVTAVGGAHVMLRKFDPLQVCQLVQTERVTSFAIVPTMGTVLVNLPELGRYDLSSLEWILVGGAAASQELIAEVEAKLGCKCYCGYGLTETAPVLTISYLSGSELKLSHQEQLRLQSMTGRSILGVELRVVDTADHDVPRDGSTVGEIAVRGDGIMEGYWRHPEETSAVFRDGWFLTGDMAVWDEEGGLLIVDRKKEIIISGGENISSLEIEMALAAHPAVYECAVIAVPDEMWGELPKAFVVRRENGAATEQDLIDFLKLRLARFKIPRSFEFVPALPKGGTGKILKKILREKYWSSQTKQVH